MANMASVAYAIEGSEKSLTEILRAICLAIHGDSKHWEEYKVCINLGFPEEELEDKRLGGEISEEPTLRDGVLKFYAEERWDLQDFEKLLIQKFPDITVYWVVEESGCEVYGTNDKEGKYFPERFYLDACVDGIYFSEYFSTEKEMYRWLSNKTVGRIKSAQDIEDFNDYEDSKADEENYILIHEFEVVD